MIGIRARGELEPIADAIAALDEVDYVVITAGSYDLLVEVVCESDEELLSVLSTKIRTIENVDLHRDVHVPPAAQADLLLGCALSRPRAGTALSAVARDRRRRLGAARAAAGRPRRRRRRRRRRLHRALDRLLPAARGPRRCGSWCSRPRRPGFGASGRNGGWCSALFPASLSTAGRPSRLLAAVARASRSTRRCAPPSTRCCAWPPRRASTPGPTRAACSRSPAAASQWRQARRDVADGARLGPRRGRPAAAGRPRGDARGWRRPGCWVRPTPRTAPRSTPRGWCADWRARSSGAAAGSSSRPGCSRCSPGRARHRPRHGCAPTSWCAPPRATPGRSSR